MSRNTIDSRRDIPTLLLTSLQLSKPRRAILSLLANAGKFYHQFSSYFSRPLSKTVRFNVLKVVSNSIIGSVKKQFVLF